MARGKFPPIFTPNTLELMIEYTLIQTYWIEYVK
jgi:hypothetical protein